MTGGESRTFSKEFALEHRTDPPLTDQSSAYLTEDFGGIEGTGWVPIRFVDNDSFLYRERAEDSQNPWVCRYHLRTGQKISFSGSGWCRKSVQRKCFQF